jgi:hypothetical protein
VLYILSVYYRQLRIYTPKRQWKKRGGVGEVLTCEKL